VVGKNTIYWHCGQKCGVPAVTKIDELTGTIKGAHSHPPGPCRDKRIPARDLIFGSKHGLSDEQLVLIPTDHALENRICRGRKQLNFPELDAEPLMSLEIPEQFYATTSGERFIIYDSRTDRQIPSPSRQSSPPHRNQQIDRIIMFASQSALQLLHQTTDWSMDGTFKSCPKVFKVFKSGQLFVIGAVIRHRMFPCVYTLLTSQTRATFEVVFAGLKRLLPANIICDYDLAAMKVFQHLYSTTHIQGYFHKYFTFFINKNVR
jgi:hypothetical protein